MKKNRAGRNSESQIVSQKLIEEATMKSWMRAKGLVNDGEFSKAARQINEAGVAFPK